MALVNHAKKEINAKIVYYGPAGSGKSTALTYIYSRIRPSLRGELKNTPAGADNLLFFDFSPFETPLPNGYRVRLHVYTLTGKVSNSATWKMTLKGADGIIIMISSPGERTDETSESVSQLRDLLSAYGVGLNEIPAVLQLNSFGRESLADEQAEIASALDLARLATFSANASRGEGLLEALTTLSHQVIDRVLVKNEPSGDYAPPSPADAEDPVRKNVPADQDDVPDIDRSPQVTLVSSEIVSKEGAIRIPLEISQGGSHRRLVVTVKVDFE